MKIEVVTNNQGTFEVLEKDLKKTFTQESTNSEVEIHQFKLVEKPSTKLLIAPWEKLIIQNMVAAAQKHLIIFDKNFDEKLLFTLIGMSLGIRNPKALDGTLVFNDFNDDGESILNSVPEIGDNRFKIECLFTEDDVESETKLVLKYPKAGDYSILKYFESYEFTSIEVNLDKANDALYMFLGLAFISGVKINAVGEEDNFIIRKLTDYNKDK